MSDILKQKLHNKIDAMPDDHARQLLDFVEFLESKYNRSQRKASPFERLGETVEGTLNADKLRDAAGKGAADLAEAAGKIMGGLAAAARAAAEEFQAAAKKAAAAGEEADGEKADGEETDTDKESGAPAG
jgi:hypothetical protein